MWDVREFDLDVLGSVEGSAEIEVGNVEGAEAGALSGENAVDHQFDQFEWCRFGSDVTWVTDAVAGYGDASSIGISLFRADFADNIAVADFFETIRRYVCEVNDMEGISAVDWLFGRICASEALAETAKFFGVGGAPQLLVCRVFDELAIFQGFTSFVVQNGGGNEGIGGFVGMCGLCNIGEHDEVGTGFGLSGSSLDARTGMEGDGFTKTGGVGDDEGWRR